jgi:outer membrane protein assembly factor BamB
MRFQIRRDCLKFLAPILSLSAVLGSTTYTFAADWPEWRGPDSSNAIEETGFPVQWSAKDNIRWKIELPDRGNSSPIVVDGKVIITQAIEKEHRRTTMAFDRHTGKLLWQKEVIYDQKETTHPQNPYCAASPTTDGERIVSTYGSAGVYAYDLDGNVLWNRDLGPQVHIWGNAVSPVFHKNLCIIYHGPGPHAAIYALDKETGKTVWKYVEPEVNQKGRTDGFRGNENGNTGSFSTPLIVKYDGRTEMIMTFPNDMVAFNPTNGEKIWWATGMNPLVYTSPIVGDDIAVGMGGYKGSTIGVELGGKGDVTDSHRLWQNVGIGNNIGSGVIYEGHIYFLNSSGIATCQDLKTGKTLWEERARGEARKSTTWSTMIRSGEHLYCLNQSSEMVILEASPTFNLLAINPLDKAMCNSTQAMSDGEIFIRTWDHLWCVSERKKDTL